MAGPSDFPNGFAQGIVIRGVPLTVTNPGKVFWVNGSSVLAPGAVGGSDGNDGTYRRPFATIDYAVGKCTANRGDIIVVMPGHSEDISAAGSLTVDIAGVAIIGLGTGSDRPDLNFSAAAATVEVDAANVTLYNLTFTADVTAVATGVNVDANYCTISNCEFNFNATGDDFVQMLDVDTVTGTVVVDSKLIAETGAAGCDQAIRLDTAHQTEIRGNWIAGDFTDAAIVSEGALSTNIIIADNYIYSTDTTAGGLVDLDVADTGLLINNRMGTLFATAPETAVDPGSLLACENYVCNAVDESGALVPTTVST